MKQITITESFTVQKPSYDRFAKIQTEIKTCSDSHIKIEINVENRFGLTFIFLISTLPYLANKYHKTINIYCNRKSFLLFRKLGFLSKDCQYDVGQDYSDELKNRAALITQDEDIFKIVTEITREAPVEMSDELAALFISKAGEMYNNAREHSQGTVIGAKFFKNQKSRYCFSCYDTGIGIPNKVMSFIEGISDSKKAFQWAMIPGNSTASGDVPRGLGLGLLKSFANANDGTIRICSGNILYVYEKKASQSAHTETYHVLENEFHGTLFEMDIVADNDRRYILG